MKRDKNGYYIVAMGKPGVPDGEIEIGFSPGLRMSLFTAVDWAQKNNYPENEIYIGKWKNKQALDVRSLNDWRIEYFLNYRKYSSKVRKQ